jgi:Holliday junction resolvase
VRPFTDLSAYPLCAYFLSGYLQQRDDEDNFPKKQFPEIFGRYEAIFRDAMRVLGLTKEALARRSEFNFGSGSAQNLEGGIAILRSVVLLDNCGFTDIALVNPPNGEKSADLLATRKAHRVCFEVKAITKKSAPHKEQLLEEQVYLKVTEFAQGASKQLAATAAREGCAVKILICIINWFEQSIYLTPQDYQQIVNKLESYKLEDYDEQRHLTGINGIWFQPKFGNYIPPYLDEIGKIID